MTPCSFMVEKCFEVSEKEHKHNANLRRDLTQKFSQLSELGADLFTQEEDKPWTKKIHGMKVDDGGKHDVVKRGGAI